MGEEKSARHIGDTDCILEIRLDTMRPGSLVRERFAKLRTGMSVAEAVQIGVSKFDLACAINRDRVVLNWQQQEPSEQKPKNTGLEEEHDPSPLGSDPHFRFEYQLRDFLADNLDAISIEGRKLRLYTGGHCNGVEYQTGVGPIDLLATDSGGALYVFELKRATSVDRAMGQLTRYMGWVKENVGQGKNVYGVIVARAISGSLRFARTAVPNVYLFEYGVTLNLKQAHDLPLR